MTRKSFLFTATIASLFVLNVHQAEAVVSLGTGSGSLIGGDLTDPNNDGTGGGANYDAIFASNNEPGFGGGEVSFNVFNNGTGKWCCDDPSPGPGPGFQLDATILPTGGNPAAPYGYLLQTFTMMTSNDSPPRDPVDWQILGSNDGTNFDVIFDSLGTDFFTGGSRNEVWQFSEGVDYPVQTLGYTTFRYSVTETGGTTQHALGQIEYFGTVAPVPEPSTLALAALSLMGLTLLSRRRRNR